MAQGGESGYDGGANPVRPAPMPESKLLELHGICCGYGGHPVVRGLSLALERGGSAALLGASGCGKTSVLRAIAGFLPLTRGRITMAGRTLCDPAGGLPPEARRIGMVFQQRALFPHLDVERNIAFGLDNLDRGERRRRTSQLLELMRLDGLEHRHPHQLSGGQGQRVALARALAPRPPLLLLDEPFSELDADLRRELLPQLRAMLKSQGIGTLMVTHDQHEAFAMADQMGIMDDGTLQQWGTPMQLYDAPKSAFVARFLGATAIRGRLDAGRVNTELGALPAPQGMAAGAVALMLRADDLVVDPRSEIRALAVDKHFSGPRTRYTLQLPSGERVQCWQAGRADFEPGSQVPVRICGRPPIFARQPAAAGAPLATDAPVC